MKKRILILLLVVLALCCVFAACDKTYSVTFVYQDEAETSKTVVFDDDFAVPAPTNGYKVFGGWYTDAACTDGNQWTKPEKLDGDVTVYAKWTTAAVTFKFNNGNPDKTAEYNEEFALPAIPIRTNYVFAGWYTDDACTDGNEWAGPESLTGSVTLYAKWKEHTTHDFPDSYFMYASCSEPYCTAVNRLPSTDSAKELFVYTYNDEKAAEIEAHYQAILAALAPEGLVAEDAFEELFLAYDDDVSYIVEQYQTAYILRSYYNNKESKANFKTISEAYNEAVQKYYSLFRLVYEEPTYSEEFFSGWEKSEIDEILATSDSYGNEEYKTLSNQIDAVIEEYKNTSTNDVDKRSLLYGQLVALNNQLASRMGYDNYMDYAYAVEYGRDYTPADVAVMRNFVKQYIAPVYNGMSKVADGIGSLPKSAQSYYDSLTKSIFDSNATAIAGTNLIAEYFKELKAAEGTLGEQEIDFLKYAEELFKNGNYYVGKEAGAYNYWIRSKDMGVLHFGKGDSYRNAFTFVHEFGHYYNGIYNHGLSTSMDLKETHSQGNEMLFLAWLGNREDKNAAGYRKLMYDQLVDNLWIICVATAVDEFEQASYAGSYKGQPLPLMADGEHVDYHALFQNVLLEYGGQLGGQSGYWHRVVFESSAYYISYAMSALPAVELYALAMEDFDNAKTCYLKLHAFSDAKDENGEYLLVEVDKDGKKSVTGTCAEIWEYCGLGSPFDEAMFKVISEYYVSLY